MPRVYQFGREWDKARAEGKSEEESLMIAAEKAKVVKTKPKKKRKGLLAELLTRRGRRELYGGPETYLYESPEERRKRVKMEKEE